MFQSPPELRHIGTDDGHCAGTLRRYTLTPLIGRDTELAELKTTLLSGESRLLTLTGHLGVGKSRLAAALFDEVVPHLADGGHYVELETLTEHAQHAGDNPAADLRDTLRAALDIDTDLITALHDLEFLLVLDCGSLPPHGYRTLIGRLADAAPRLRILTVATQVLGVYGERRVQLAPLAVPEPSDTLELAQLAEVPAVALLVHRSRAVRPGFRLTEENRAAVTELCVRLDGLPLAIELAAPRLKASSPAALLEEIDRAPEVLRGSTADTMSRHVSMSDALEHGWSLLAPERRRLLIRLAAFSSAFDDAEVSGVCGLSPQEARGALEELVDHSLLLTREQEDGSVRFHMLRRARAHALAQLTREGGLTPAQAAHAAYFLRRAKETLPLLQGPEQTCAVRLLDRWHPEILTALDVLVQAGEGEEAAGLASDALPYWLVRGEVREAVQRLTAAEAAGECTPKTRAVTEAALGTAHLLAGDLREAEERLQSALAMFESMEDRPRAALVMTAMARLERARGDLGRARILLERAREELRTLDDGHTCALAAGLLAEVCRDDTDGIGPADTSGKARDRSEAADGSTGESQADGTAHSRSDGDSEGKSGSGSGSKGDGKAGRSGTKAGSGTQQAIRLAEESVRLYEETGDAREAALSTLTLAGLLAADGDTDRAEELSCQALQVLHDIGDLPALVSALRVTTAVFVRRNRRAQEAWERAARLLATADSIEKRTGCAPPRQSAAEHHALAARARERLGKAAFEEQQAAGRALSVGEAVTQSVTPFAQPPVSPLPPGTADVLTRRETEVANLVAEGLSNRLVASRLGIAEWTAVNTLRKVMRKLDCTSRVEVANHVLRTRAQTAQRDKNRSVAV
ncbi:LuxR C-terminal-related transcriptional regulator [Streptomyces sp. N2-109]|uniref:LuxR C-terminal-related transcriptional regulator n=1 Tax=Streptomyces gossypii TaxID=2883101 RepID=A0ABT2K562_9ACTN|nr:LuxR C-terminal-related transcriptional regulator [Streptomyces gossypii]MCT2594640.1 LuxR C-terminal-related transcriptional regulator [Streptomyces gossypii]